MKSSSMSCNHILRLHNQCTPCTELQHKVSAFAKAYHACLDARARLFYQVVVNTLSVPLGTSKAKQPDTM